MARFPWRARTLLSAAVALSTSTSLPAKTLPTSIAGAIAALKPGGFLSASQIAPEEPMMMIVSLHEQRAYAYRNGVIIGVSTISSGKDGHPTPTGIFTILQKQVEHKSNLYNAAPMPFMQRLTWDGIAMHAGNLPGYPASHGCACHPPLPNRSMPPRARA